MFTDYTPGAFYDAMSRFKKLWEEIGVDGRYTARNNARKSVYYWDKPADRYIRFAYSQKEIIRR